MNLNGRIPVEPLDEERLTNIERKLVVSVSEMRAPARRMPRFMLAFAGAALAVAVAGFVGWKLRGDGAIMAPGDAVETFALNTDNGNTLQLGDARLGNIALTSGAATDLRVQRGRDRVVIEMTRGAIDMAVEHKPGRVLVVRAGDTEIEDVGTKFAVEYDGKNKLEVRVTEGEVKVKRGGKHEDLKAGFAWSLDIGKVVTIAELDAHVATVVASAETNAAGDPEIAIDTSGTGTPTTAAGSNGSATGSNGNTGSGSGHSNAGSGSAHGGGSGSGSGARKSGTPNARKALLAAQVDGPEDIGTTDYAKSRATYLERIGSTKTTSAVDEEKARLQYSMAYLEHMNKNDSAAKSWIRGLLARQGGSAYRSALWLNVRIHCIKAFDDECRRAAELYRRKFPDGMHTGIADEILKDIARN